jgi:hypothetical protein
MPTYLMRLIASLKAKFTMNRASFPSLMSKGSTMMYGKKKTAKKPMKTKKKAVTKKKPMSGKKKGY